MIGLALSVGVVLVVLVISVWRVRLLRYPAADDRRSDGSPTVPASPDQPLAADDDTSWTALDDHQLARLLRDSSP